MQIQRNYTLIAAVAIAILAVACVGGAYALTSEVSVENKVNAQTLSADISQGEDPIKTPFIFDQLSSNAVDKGTGYGYDATNNRQILDSYTLHVKYSSDSDIELKVFLSFNDLRLLPGFDHITVVVGETTLSLYEGKAVANPTPSIIIEANKDYAIKIDLTLNNSAFLSYSDVANLDEAQSILDLSNLVFNFVASPAPVTP